MNLADANTYLCQLLGALVPNPMRNPKHSDQCRLLRSALRAKLRLLVRDPNGFFFYLLFAWWTLSTQNADATIVSYGKSGRTWLERMLLECILEELGIDSLKYRSLAELCHKHADWPKIVMTHAGSNWEGVIYDENTIASIPTDRYARGKVLFLYRDPRDVLVSAFHHVKFRTGLSDLTPDGLIESPAIGLRKTINFMNHWMQFYKEHTDSCIGVSYEQLRGDTRTNLQQIISFLNLDVSSESIDNAIESCSFRAMKSKEREGAFENPRLAPTRKEEECSFKIRSGKTGEYRDFFTEQQIEHMNAIIDSELEVDFHYQTNAPSE